MTDVLDRTVSSGDPGVRNAGPAAPVRPARPDFDLSGPGRVVLAALAASAGAIHLAMVPSHMDSSTAEGLGFALVGWIQVVTAILLLTRPSRALLRFAMLSTVAFLGVWVISRAYGLPFGDHAWHPHDAAFVDLVAVGIEIALVVLAGVWLSRPEWGRDWSRATLVAGAMVPVAVVALGTAAIASPSARDHAHGTHAGHDDAAAVSDGHAHGVGTAAAADDKGLSALSNGHQHGVDEEVKLDPSTQIALTQQLNQLRTLVERYPNIAAAEAAGYRRAGPFSPGLGTHYGGMGRAFPEDVIQGVDGPMTPMLVFDGTAPDAPLAGFMLLTYGGQAETPPEGFIGPNDHWHYHTNTCIVMRNGTIEAPLGADRDVDAADCRAVGGTLIKVTTNMVHVWAVPGYESPTGMFSEINARLTCPDGTYYTVKKRVDFGVNRCKSAQV